MMGIGDGFPNFDPTFNLISRRYLTGIVSSHVRSYPCSPPLILSQFLPFSASVSDTEGSTTITTV